MRDSYGLLAAAYRLVAEAANRLVAAILLVLLAPLIVFLAISIRVDSPGSVFIRCRRVGQGGREFGMVKFRKMYAGAEGLPLTSPDDDRFTRVGRVLATYKLDEVPQLWNVLCGQMRLVGPRPENPGFVKLQQQAFSEICKVKPGITCLSQLAFARESEILDPQNRVADYLERVFPQKVQLERLYAERRSIGMDVRILAATIFVIIFRGEVAAHRDSGRLSVRRRPIPDAAVETSAAIESADVASG